MTDSEVAEVRRSVSPDDAGRTHSVVVERTYAVDTGELWRAITDPDRIGTWFLRIGGDLRIGGRYQLDGHAGGTIERCDPPKSYAVTWESGPEPGAEVSRLLVAVVQEAGGAALRIEHDVPASDYWERFGPAATALGWEGALRGLALHLTSGAPLDPEAEAAWAASEEGLDFLRSAGEAWAEVTEAAGYDATWARDAAARTVAAYSGEG